MNCRMCNGDRLSMFLDLGFTPPADHFCRTDQLREPGIYYPLQVYMCDDCGLAQLGFVVSPEVLYRNDYPYESSTTKTGHEHWKDFANSVVSRFDLSSKDLVVDIGSNVGVLLSAFKENDIRVMGVDPAANIVMIARDRGIDTLCDFFNSESTDLIKVNHGQAAVITATNVFAHVDDLTAFMGNIKNLLKPDGIFIFEAPYLVHLLEKNEYDTIYHEHLSYLSVKPLIPFFGKFGMEVFDIEQVDIHGGSFRVYTAGTGRQKVSSIVEDMIEDERRRGIHSHDVLKEFSEKVKKNKRDLMWMLRSLKHKGAAIAGVSAPAKGMTLLNYCGIDRDLLDFVTEKASLKIGRYTPGSHIPVVSDDVLLEKMPDYALLLAWNFADEIIKNLSEYEQKGGKFIIPVPTPTIID